MSSNQPLVSVVIPTYKRADLLVRAVNSVKHQTYSNIEIIVVDDANDAATFALIGKDPEVTLLINETNKGGCYSRNRGFRESKGAYINFLDDDDILYPTKIEKQISHYLNNPRNIDRLGMVTCHTNDGRTGEILVMRNRFSGDVHKRILSKFLLHGTETILYIREALERVQGFDEELVSSQEYDLQIRVSEYYTIDYVDEILTERFISVDQISVNFDKKLKGAKQIYQKHKAAYKKYGIGYALRLALKYQLLFMKYRIAKVMGVSFFNRFLR